MDEWRYSSGIMYFSIYGLDVRSRLYGTDSDITSGEKLFFIKLKIIFYRNKNYFL